MEGDAIYMSNAVESFSPASSAASASSPRKKSILEAAPAAQQGSRKNLSGTPLLPRVPSKQQLKPHSPVREGEHTQDGLRSLRAENERLFATLAALRSGPAEGDDNSKKSGSQAPNTAPPHSSEVKVSLSGGSSKEGSAHLLAATQKRGTEPVIDFPSTCWTLTEPPSDQGAQPARAGDAASETSALAPTDPQPSSHALAATPRQALETPREIKETAEELSKLLPVEAKQRLQKLHPSVKWLTFLRLSSAARASIILEMSETEREKALHMLPKQEREVTQRAIGHVFPVAQRVNRHHDVSLPPTRSCEASTTDTEHTSPLARLMQRQSSMDIERVSPVARLMHRDSTPDMERNSPVAALMQRHREQEQERLDLAATLGGSATFRQRAGDTTNLQRAGGTTSLPRAGDAVLTADFVRHRPASPSSEQRPDVSVFHCYKSIEERIYGMDKAPAAGKSSPAAVLTNGAQSSRNNGRPSASSQPGEAPPPRRPLPCPPSKACHGAYLAAGRGDLTCTDQATPHGDRSGTGQGRGDFTGTDRAMRAVRSLSPPPSRPPPKPPGPPCVALPARDERVLGSSSAAVANAWLSKSPPSGGRQSSGGGQTLSPRWAGIEASSRALETEAHRSGPVPAKGTGADSTEAHGIGTDRSLALAEAEADRSGWLPSAAYSYTDDCNVQSALWSPIPHDQSASRPTRWPDPGCSTTGRLGPSAVLRSSSTGRLAPSSVLMAATKDQLPWTSWVKRNTGLAARTRAVYRSPQVPTQALISRRRVRVSDTCRLHFRVCVCVRQRRMCVYPTPAGCDACRLCFHSIGRLLVHYLVCARPMPVFSISCLCIRIPCLCWRSLTVLRYIH